jgi:sulfate adenylyltransferase subunit 2
LQRLKAEAIYIMREVVAQAQNPVMLYSMGRDCEVMVHLARKAFAAGSPPFPLLHALSPDVPLLLITRSLRAS